MTPANYRRVRQAEHAVCCALRFLRVNHVVAVALYSMKRGVSGKTRVGDAVRWVEEQIGKMPGRAMRAATRMDDRAPCPHCGRETALVELAELKTYCYSCSYCGHDPTIGGDYAQSDD